MYMFQEEILPEENLQYINSSLKDVKRIENGQNLHKSTHCEKVLKTSKESDVSHRCKSCLDLYDLDGISKVKCLRFCDWFGKRTQTEASTVLPSSDITFQKMIDCFVHPEVIAVISRLIKQP